MRESTNPRVRTHESAQFRLSRRNVRVQKHHSFQKNDDKSHGKNRP